MKTIDVGIMDIDVKTSILELRSEVQNTKKKIPGNKYELEVVLEDKLYPEIYYKHQPGSVVVDETLAKTKAQGLQIARWTLTKDKKLMKFNMEINVEP